MSRYANAWMVYWKAGHRCAPRSICAHASRPNSRKAGCQWGYVTAQLSLKLPWAAMDTADSVLQIIHITAHVKILMAVPTRSQWTAGLKAAVH